jgi:TolB-like protein/DNA-binding winged helix-turn-helix (wHTH) protein
LGFQLGDWQVYPDQGLLVGDDKQTHLEPKVMEVLVYLAEHHGEVVRRTELIEHIWSGTFVSDEVLSRAISVLRTSLVDDRMSPSYIQTLPKVGYRLLMPVTPLQDGETEPGAVERKQPLIIWVAAFAVTIVVIAGFFIWLDKSDVIDPGSPAAYADISDWFDYLVEAKEGSAGVTSIAVLPFDDLSENEEGAFFSEGLTDELTMSLSKVKGLKVVARRSSYSFKNRSDDVPTIGRLLNADAIFEGTIRREGDQLRINAQLCDVSDGYLMWSNIYERNVRDVFDVQENIAAAVVEAMRGHFKDGSLQTPLTKQAPPDMEAYQLYLMNGNFMWRLRGEQPLRNSIQLYRQALVIDPSFSRAYISLANALVILPFYSSEPMEPMFQQAMEVLAGFQFTENRELGEVEAIHGFIAWNRWQWVKAEEHFRKALELAPDSPNVYQWYSQLLSGVGRNKDGLKAAKRARDLDQISPVINDRLAMAYLWVGDNVRAAEQFAIGAQLGFRNAINPGYMVFLARQQRFNEFKSIMAALHRGSPNPPTWIIENADTVLLPENREKALALATQADEEGSFSRHFIRFGLWIEIGGIDQAYQTFDALRDTWPQFLQMEFIFSEEAKAFRQDPRFKKLAKEVGWQEYWQIYGGPDEG